MEQKIEKIYAEIQKIRYMFDSSMEVEFNDSLTLRFKTFWNFDINRLQEILKRNKALMFIQSKNNMVEVMIH